MVIKNKEEKLRRQEEQALKKAERDEKRLARTIGREECWHCGRWSMMRYYERCMFCGTSYEE